MMNKQDKKRITELFQDKRRQKTEHAGFLALEKLTAKDDDKHWYDDRIDDIFWEIDELYELEKEILGE